MSFATAEVSNVNVCQIELWTYVPSAHLFTMCEIAIAKRAATAMTSSGENSVILLFIANRWPVANCNNPQVTFNFEKSKQEVNERQVFSETAKFESFSWSLQSNKTDERSCMQEHWWTQGFSYVYSPYDSSADGPSQCLICTASQKSRKLLRVTEYVRL